MDYHLSICHFVMAEESLELSPFERNRGAEAAMSSITAKAEDHDAAGGPGALLRPAVRGFGAPSRLSQVPSAGIRGYEGRSHAPHSRLVVEASRI